MCFDGLCGYEQAQPLIICLPPPHDFAGLLAEGGRAGGAGKHGATPATLGGGGPQEGPPHVDEESPPGVPAAPG